MTDPKPHAQVAVKPLEWILDADRAEEFPAWSAFPHNAASYRIFKAWWGMRGKWGYVCNGGFYLTEQDAKAAAQADYEARVRSALAPAPAVPDDVEIAALGLSAIVEGITGAMRHGTWRDERGVRLKDTPEWVALYNALNAANRAAIARVSDRPGPDAAAEAVDALGNIAAMGYSDDPAVQANIARMAVEMARSARSAFFKGQQP